MTELLKQLGEVEIHIKLLEAKKTGLTRQILEQLKNEQQPTSTTETGKAETASEPSAEDQPTGTPV